MQLNVCTESLRIVDVKIQIIPIGRQTVITRDNVNVEMYVHQLAFRYQSTNGLVPLAVNPLYISKYATPIARHSESVIYDRLLLKERRLHYDTS